MPEGTLALLGRAAGPVVVDDVLEVGELIGAVEFPVGAGGVHEDQVQVKVEQVRDRPEDITGDLIERVEQEVQPMRRRGRVSARNHRWDA